MAYKISDSCISCGSCASECPVALFQKAMHITKSTAELAWIAVLAQQHVLPVRLKLNNFY